MKRHNQSCSERTRQQNGDQFSGKSRFLVYIVSMFTLVLCLRSNRLAFALFRFFARRILPSWPHDVIIFCVFFSFLSLPAITAWACRSKSISSHPLTVVWHWTWSSRSPQVALSEKRVREEKRDSHVTRGSSPQLHLIRTTMSREVLLSSNREHNFFC